MKVPCAFNAASCLAEYAKTLPPRGTHRRGRAYQDLVDFTGSSRHSVERWLNGTKMPLGIARIKLEFFLGMKGFPPEELLQLANVYPLGYQLAETLAFCNVSLDEVTKAIGYVDDHEVLRIARGRGTAGPVYAPKISAFCAKMQNEMELKRCYWEKRLGGTVEAPTEPSKPFVCGVPQTLIPVNRRAAQETAAHLIFALAPLARLIGQDLGPEDRKAVRKMIEDSDGESVLFKLITHLTMISGEQARKQVLGAKAFIERKEVGR